ncbi:MAG: molecular chaperone HtpG [Chloroflexota bacterium]
MVAESQSTAAIAFKAETRQLLDILIHSLYTEREIFLRELVSNASDALTRLSFEQLTNHDVLDPDAPLEIRITGDPEAGMLTISDTGIGMTADEMVANLGTIARSGAREFLQAAAAGGHSVTDLIGQFGVGFYSVFMAAEWVRVVSHSYRRDAQAAQWFCTGEDTFTVESAEKETRGTTITIKLKEDAKEFAQASRLSAVIRKHSDFIPYPIFIGDAAEQANRQSALWRQSPREVKPEDYAEFYQQMTLDFEPPLVYAHMSVDAPLQMYALLFIPASPERSMFSLRKEDGLKLYARKVLIQEYNRDLLPEYLGFVQGVVDSEDLPLNVSRESVQSNRVMAGLKKLVTGKVLDTLKKLAADDPETYAKFWAAYSRYLKQGVAIEPGEPEALYPLLRFHTTEDQANWSSLDDYVKAMKPDQKDIYYLMADDDRSALVSPHLDALRAHGYPALLMTDPVDAFLLTRLTRYQEHALVNAAAADLPVPEAARQAQGEDAPALAESEHAGLIERFKTLLGERVSDVRMTDRLTGSPARLVDPQGAPNQEMQRVYKLLNKEFDAPKKILELNPRHPIVARLAALGPGHPLGALVIEQVYEDALLVEGLHPDPAGMISRIQKIIEAALV